MSALVYLVMASFGHGRAGGAPPLAEWAANFITMLADWYLWALIAPLVLWIGSRLSFTRGNRVPVVAAHILLGVAVAFVKLTIRYWIGRFVPWLPTAGWPGIFDQLPTNVLVYWSILGVGYALEYYSRYRERELRAAHLESSLARAQLDVLRMQVNPHFLFNTLHTISVLVREHENDSADRMIARLSELLRLSIDLEATHEVPLARELAILDSYLDIQKLRFQERLRVEFAVEAGAREALVPTMLLQPLVENAIRHGLSKRDSGGRIDIRAKRVGDQLEITISDDGPGLPLGFQIGTRGVGLSNTRARLEHLYGSQHIFDLRNQPEGGLSVTVRIPWHVAAATATARAS
jgi:signal transduction histidine kinase